MAQSRVLISRLEDKAKAPLLAPGVFDGLSSMMAEKAGAEALYLSGASFATPALDVLTSDWFLCQKWRKMLQRLRIGWTGL